MYLLKIVKFAIISFHNPMQFATALFHNFETNRALYLTIFRTNRASISQFGGKGCLHNLGKKSPESNPYLFTILRKTLYFFTILWKTVLTFSQFCRYRTLHNSGKKSLFCYEFLLLSCCWVALYKCKQLLMAYSNVHLLQKTHR